MKKHLTTLLVMFIILASGCSLNMKIDLPYSIEQAYRNNDVVDILNGNSLYNLEAIEDFMDSVKNGEKDELRIARYDKDVMKRVDFDNPTYILDLKFNGKKIGLTIYNLHSEGKIAKGKYEVFEKMDKVSSKDDVSYILLSNNGERSHHILTIPNESYIDNETQREIDNRFGKK